MLIVMTLALPIAMSYLSLRVERASGPQRMARLAPIGFLGCGLLLAFLSLLGLAFLVAVILVGLVSLVVRTAAMEGLIVAGLGLLLVLIAVALVWDMLVVLALVHSSGEGMGPLDSLIEAVGDAMEDPLTLLACGIAVHVITSIVGVIVALLTSPLPHTPLTLQVPARISLGGAAKVLEGLGLQVRGVSVARLAASTLTSMLIWPLIASTTLSYYLHLRGDWTSRST